MTKTGIIISATHSRLNNCARQFASCSTNCAQQGAAVLHNWLPRAIQYCGSQATAVPFCVANYYQSAKNVWKRHHHNIKQSRLSARNATVSKLQASHQGTYSESLVSHQSYSVWDFSFSSLASRFSLSVSQCLSRLSSSKSQVKPDAKIAVIFSTNQYDCFACTIRIHTANGFAAEVEIEGEIRQVLSEQTITSLRSLKSVLMRIHLRLIQEGKPIHPTVAIVQAKKV